MTTSFRERPHEAAPPEINPFEEPKTDRAHATSNAEEAEDEAKKEDLPATLLGPGWHQLGSITAEYLYLGEVFNNARGGIATKGATRYRGNFDLTLSLDTGRAGWWSGGTFCVYAHNSHGRTLTRDFVGDAQFYSDLDTSPKPQDVTQLGEYWYRHAFDEDALSVRIGRQDPNTDFAFADMGEDFVNSSFITLPNVPMPYWPFETMGVSSLYQVSEKLRLGGGAYDQGRDVNQWWLVTTSRGVFFIGQADYQPFADHEDARRTLIRFGGWCSSSHTEAVDASRVFENNFGLYVTAERMLLCEAGSADQGLGAFFQFSWAPPDRNQIDRAFGGGLLSRGLLPCRDQDTLGLGFSLVEFSPTLRELTGQTRENAVELFYKARLREGLAIQPDLQYIVRPSGIHHDALVVGVRVEANL